MTTFRPGYKGVVGRGQHNRISKYRDTIFSDEANANTDWIPVNAGDKINFLAHAAQLRRKVVKGLVVPNEFNVIRLNQAPIGSVTLKHKLGGEDDEHAAVLGSWRDVMVVYNETIQMSGFMRVEFGCMSGQQDSQHSDEALGNELTPHGIFVSLERHP